MTVHDLKEAAYQAGLRYMNHGTPENLRHWRRAMWRARKAERAALDILAGIRGAA